MKHYKILFLSMSCNIEFYEMSRKVVHDTWARDIIAGKYEGCGFYSYTSIHNGQDRNAYIEDNCIYVDESDHSEHTYSKTVRALEILQENGITWDYIIRTNTSVFINVKKMLEVFENLQPDTIYGPLSKYEWMTISPEKVDHLVVPSGWMLVLPKKFTDEMINHKYDFYEDSQIVIDTVGEYTTTGNMSQADDILIGLLDYVLRKYYGVDIPLGDLSQYTAHFRTKLHNRFIQPELPDWLHKPQWYHVDSKDILNMPFVQVRKFFVEPQYRYMECEEMYELQKIIDDSE